MLGEHEDGFGNNRGSGIFAASNRLRLAAAPTFALMVLLTGDPFFGVYHWLDRAPKGRNEAGIWWRRHDEYGSK